MPADARRPRCSSPSASSTAGSERPYTARARGSFRDLESLPFRGQVFEEHVPGRFDRPAERKTPDDDPPEPLEDAGRVQGDAMTVVERSSRDVRVVAAE